MEFKPWNSPPPVDRFNGNNGNGNAGNGGHGNHGGGNGNHGNTNDPDYLRRLRERVRLLSQMQNQWVIGPYGWIVYPDGSYFATSYYNDYRPVFQGVANSYDQTLAGQDSRAQNVPSASGEPASDRDRGDRALASGEVKIAIDAYRRHLLTDTTDATATRSLGVAMLISGNAADACAVVRRAYSLDPSLASQPFNLSLLSPDGVSSTELVQRAVRDAQRNKSASAWLTAAVLAQSEGRETVALTMLDKARKEGLDSKIADRLAETIEAHVASLPARRSVR
jgi:hypothetical protein